MFSETQKQAMMVIVFVAVFAFAGTWYYETMFGKGQLKVIEEQTAKLETDIQALTAKRDEYRALKAQEKLILEMAATVKKAAERLPRSPEESEFHQILADIMKATSVYPIQVEKLKPLARDVYTEIPYRVECFVKYHNMGELFNAIEENPKRFMRIKQFKITSQSGILRERPSVQYAIIEISTYSFNPRPENLAQH